MKGWILGCDSSGGAISTDAGERFKFAISEWKDPGWPAARDEVDFIGANGAATEIYPAIAIGAARTGTGSAAGFAPVVPAMATPTAFLSAAPAEPIAAPSAFYQPAPQPVRKKVGLFRAIGLAYRKMFNFTGRACRAEYWYYTIIVIFIESIFLGVYFASMAKIGMDCANSVGASEGDAFQACVTNAAGGAMQSYYAAVGKGLLLTFPGLALTVRRLHDTGRSGWRYLWAIVPFGAFALLFWVAQRGARGPNKYGPDPLIQTQAV